MECPKCKHTMNEIADEHFSALKCGGCQGIWFRDGSHEIAKGIAGAAKMDEIDAHAAAAYNKLRDIDCPECKRKMLKMTDRTQFHIKFEACTDCHGVFFDSGEFSDYSEYTLIERIKQSIETLKSNLKS